MIEEKPRRLGHSRFVILPHRQHVRFRRTAVLALTLALAAGGVLAAYAAANGLADFVPVSAAVAVIPLLGAGISLWRLLAAWEAGPGRAHAVLAAFSVALLSWSIAAIAYLVDRAWGGEVLEFPSPIDIPNYVSAIFWTIGVWLLYEAAVDDFLDEVVHSSYLLTLITVACFFVLTVAEGKDYGSVMWSGHDLAKHVTQALLPLAWAVNGFLLFRASRGKIGRRFLGDRKAMRALALGLGLATVSDLLFAFGIEIADREPLHPFAYRPGGAADIVAMAAYFSLAFGLVHFPLEGKLFRRDDDAAADVNALDPVDPLAPPAGRG